MDLFKMRSAFLIIILFICSFYYLQAQDTIVLHNGEEIRAKVMDTSDIVIKYKEYGSQDTVSVFTVFKSDVKLIKYADGARDELSKPGDKEDKPETKTMFGKKYKVFETDFVQAFYIGAEYSISNRYRLGNLIDFWQNLNNDPNAEIDQHGGFFIYKMGTFLPLDVNKRNWFGAEIQVMKTPEDAINATYNYSNGITGVNFNASFMNVLLFYGRSLNYKRNLLLTFEPTLNTCMMDGSITILNDVYDIDKAIGLGFEFDLGLRYIISKRFLADIHVGRRFLKVQELHKNEDSETGYSSFYADSSKEEFLKVDWGGFYLTAGFNISINRKIKAMIPE